MSALYEPAFATPTGGVEKPAGRYMTRAYFTAAPTNGLPGYEHGCFGIDLTNAVAYLNTGTSASSTWTAFEFGSVTTKRVASGVIPLDGSNPTPVTTGLTTIVTASATLQRTTAPSSGTAFVTCDFTGLDGILQIYGWVLAGTASAGTENVSWFVSGT